MEMRGDLQSMHGLPIKLYYWQSRGLLVAAFQLRYLDGDDSGRHAFLDIPTSLCRKFERRFRELKNQCYPCQDAIIWCRQLIVAPLNE